MNSPSLPGAENNTTEDRSLQYINTVDYEKLKDKIKELCSVMTELQTKSVASRRLRYVEIDIEGERKAGRLQPDELYIPQHIIDTNIRREQSSYVQYVTQSPRAVILSDRNTPSTDSQLLERDVTNRLRYDGWQLPLYATIDGMQANGYGIKEVVYDETKPGHVAHEFVQLGDFGYIMDTRNIQETEMVARSYYFSRTKLLSLCESGDVPFDIQQVKKLVEGNPESGVSDAVIDNKDKSLFMIKKVMFRVKGIVHVAWIEEKHCDNWLRPPVPLFLGRRKPKVQLSMMEQIKQKITGLPITEEAYETDYPYIVFPYLISENDTISQLKGRVYLDQDCQEAASSLLSSYCTAHRRASNLYFSKDTDDPNADIAMQKNVYFEPGALIPAKIKQFQLTAPDATVMESIQTLIASNQNETSQVNFAAMNRKDSRKTATEVSAASQSAAALSTVQVVLFSQALKQMYSLMFSIIQSRVLAGLITDVSPEVRALYGKVWIIKPAGDIDVIERQQLVQTMMSAWPVMQQTPASSLFLTDLISKMFPEQAARYNQVIIQAQQQQASAQQQQQNQMVNTMAQGIMQLAKHHEFFSDTGKVNALPAIQQVAAQLEAAQPK